MILIEILIPPDHITKKLILISHMGLVSQRYMAKNDVFLQKCKKHSGMQLCFNDDQMSTDDV